MHHSPAAIKASRHTASGRPSKQLANHARHKRDLFKLFSIALLACAVSAGGTSNSHRS